MANEALVNPRWRQMLAKSLASSMKENKDSISYCLSSLAQTHPHTGMSGPVPEARFVVHRGFVNERRAENDGSSNADGPTACVLLTTTDVRAPKTTQLSKAGSSLAEIAWWLEPTKDQFRILARSHVLPSPASREHADLLKRFPKEDLAPPELKTGSFDWEQERQRIFKKMSPPLKASFCRPVPGSPLGSNDPHDWPEELPDPDEAEGNDKDYVRQALENFALIALDPIFVDQVNLGDVPNTRFQWTKADGEWKELAAVP